jgi:ABC-type sugar transport system ATPase subunit
MLLEMRRIHKSFSGVEVLSDVSFDLEAGEIHILAGENGAGKSTLIKILAGVHTDYQGEIRLGGERVRFSSPAGAAASGISVIHQELSVVDGMSAEDNIFLGREHTRAGLWMDHRTQRRKALNLLADLQLDIDIRRPIEDYPQSIRQLIEIAKAMVFDARIFIMDEPTSALNELEVERLFKLIDGLKHEGRSVIFITHRIEEIFRIGDRITVLRDGRAVGTAPVDDLTPGILIHWMVGREIAEQFPPRKRAPGNPLLHVRQLAVKHPFEAAHWSIRDLSFTLHAGEILGIAGLRGSGKSELLHGLFGTYGKLRRGRIELEGRPFTVHSAASSIQNGLVLLTNDRKNMGLVPSLNVIQNISLAALASCSSWGWMQHRREYRTALEMIDALMIKLQDPNQDVTTLSGGNQQKVVLARCWNTRPRILLLDEPTLGVDVGAKHEIYRLMNAWTEQGLAILLVASELPELLALSDRVLVLHRGRRMAEYDRDQATLEKILHAAMGGRTSA